MKCSTKGGRFCSSPGLISRRKHVNASQMQVLLSAGQGLGPHNKLQNCIGSICTSDLLNTHQMWTVCLCYSISLMQGICLCYWKQTLLSGLCFEAGISGLTTKYADFGSWRLRVCQLWEVVTENQCIWMASHRMQ